MAKAKGDVIAGVHTLLDFVEFRFPRPAIGYGGGFEHCGGARRRWFLCFLPRGRGGWDVIRTGYYPSARPPQRPPTRRTRPSLPCSCRSSSKLEVASRVEPVLDAAEIARRHGTLAGVAWRAALLTAAK